MKLPAESAAEVTSLLESAGYISNDRISTAVALTARMHRPVLVEGQPGCGKTSLAKAIASATGAELIRLQCYRGLEVENTIYEWDYMRQFLRIRMEGELAEDTDPDELEESIFAEKYLLERPILRALDRGENAVLLIDELDRAGEDFEAFLLEVLDEYQVSVPELGTISAAEPPLVIITSNRTRKIGDALKRRCLYLYLDPPEFDRELEIVRSKVPQLDAAVAEQVVEFMQSIRYQENLLRTPGISETLDWAGALAELNVATLDTDTVKRTLSTVLKEPEDLERLDEEAVAELTAAISQESGSER